MKITNRLGLPEAFVQAVANDPYSAGDSYLTASKLADPPQKRRLEIEHADELEEDAADRVWALLGQTTHVVLERAEPSEIVETRLFSTFLEKRVSGALDHYTLSRGLLRDYKVTSAWTLVYKSRIAEWEKQQNVLAELIVRNGGDVSALEIVAVLRDWSNTAAQKSKDYPQAPVVVVPLELWSAEKRVAYIEERVALHLAADAGEVPPCTDEERWAKPSKYAVMKEGRKTAVRVFDSFPEAAELAIKSGNGYSVEKRPGGFIRCESYCPAAPFCAQWAADRPVETEAAA